MGSACAKEKPGEKPGQPEEHAKKAAPEVPPVAPTHMISIPLAIPGHPSPVGESCSETPRKPSPDTDPRARRRHHRDPVKVSVIPVRNSETATIEAAAAAADHHEPLQGSSSETASVLCKDYPPPLLRFRYEIDSGAFSNGVYSARRSDYSDKKLAVKVVYNYSSSHSVEENQRMVERSFFEAMALISILKHRNIVSAYSFQMELDGRSFLAMEYVKGGTLLNYLKALPAALSEAAALAFAYQLLDGMAYSHSRGVVHGDLKAENILLEELPVRGGEEARRAYGGSTHRLVIADWGFAKLVERSPVSERLIRTAGSRDGILGSIAYAAPELLLGTTLSPTKFSDVWSTGVIMFALVMRRLPFPRCDRKNQAQCDRLLEVFDTSDTHPRMPEVVGAPEVKEMITECLHIHPASRPSFDQLLSKSCFAAIRGYPTSITPSESSDE